MSHFNIKTILSQVSVSGREYRYYNLQSDQLTSFGTVEKLPFCLKVLLENLLRHGADDKTDGIEALLHQQKTEQEISFYPARVLMQDFTGVPGVVDLAAMRQALVDQGKDPENVNPLIPVDLVIDHSVSIDAFGSENAFRQNVDMEMSRNLERYQFLKWGQASFNNFRVVPPGTGICHQVNLEYLAKTVWSQETDGHMTAYPDTLVGTDSHTTMINALGVLGWGVGGIEAEAAMLGQPVSMLIPEVVGFELKGRLPEGVTATDLVLRVVQMLRAHGVVGKFVEFYGEGLNGLALSDRATIANMAPEYGATCGFFPVDEQTLDYLRMTGRDEATLELIEVYCKAQGLWYGDKSFSPDYAETMTLDMAGVEPSLAGPKRPQDRVSLKALKSTIQAAIELRGKAKSIEQSFELADSPEPMHHGDVVIAAITSCTNTSNPSVMMAAGLVAKKAIALGMQSKPWVKTSLAPGSKVVTDYLEKAGLQSYLDQLGFNLVGYGCTTCIGNSGPLPENVARCIADNHLSVSAVLSGNRNFEGRIHPLTEDNWLASPPLVVIFALAGTVRIDLSRDSIGIDRDGNAIYLKDLWPSNKEIEQAVLNVDTAMFRKEYAEVFAGDQEWQGIQADVGKTYPFDSSSTYIQLPPFLEQQYTTAEKSNIHDANILAVLGDSVTTDHISPAGAIPKDSPAADYLRNNGIAEKDFNSYGSRRGNHEVMLRGTFGNIRLKNQMVAGVEGGYTRIAGKQETVSIYDAAMHYQKNDVATVVFAGKEYGTGSSRDWAAKGTLLLGVKAVIVETFERIHRSNLIGMGVLPLQFSNNVTVSSLQLTGDEQVDILGLSDTLTPKKLLTITIKRNGTLVHELEVQLRLDTETEVDYYMAGGVLPFVLNQL